MAYPDTVTKRAIELYEEGYSAGAIIKTLQMEFPRVDIPNERTVRRWCKTRKGDPTIASPDKVASKRMEEHFAHLAEIADLLLDGGLDKITESQEPDNYQIVEEGYSIKVFSKDELIGTLEGNLDVASQKYNSWEVFDCLMEHLEVEYPAYKTFMASSTNIPLST